MEAAIQKEIQTTGVQMIAVTKDWLKDFGIQIAKQTRQELEDELRMNREEDLIPRNTTIERLNVDPSTLWRWEKQKYLLPVRIGGKVYYRKSDIDNLINGGR